MLSVLRSGAVNAQQMEEVIVVGYKITITGDANDFMFRGQVVVPINDPLIEVDMADSDERENLVCAFYGNPDGSISFGENIMIQSAVALCLAAIVVANPPTLGAANLAAGSCLVLAQVLLDQACSD